MAIAFDVASAVAAIGTGNLTWTHTPSGTPKGVVVMIAQNVGVTDEVTSVTYGSKTLRRISSLFGNTTEAGSVYIYFAGQGLPTGAQTVTVNVNGTASSKAAFAVTATAATPEVIVEAFDAGVNNVSLANPSSTLAERTGQVCLECAVIHSGQNAPASVTAGTGFTAIGAGFDYGSQSAFAERATAVSSGGNVTYAFVSTADDVHMLGVSMTELSIQEMGVGAVAESRHSGLTGRVTR